MRRAPTRYDLRPLELGEMLDRGLRIYLEHWRPLLGLAMGIVVLLAIPMALLQGAATTEDEKAAAGFIVFMVQTFVVGGLLGAVMVVAISDIYLSGRTAAMGALRRAARFVPGVILITFLTTVATALGMVACLLPGLILAAALSLATPAYVLEGIPAVAGLRRSWRLTAGSRRRVLGYYFVFQLVAVTGGMMVGLGIGLVAGALGAPMPVIELAGNLLSAFFVPYPAIGTVLIYYDLRVRKEAFDVEILAAELAGRPAIHGEPAASRRPPGSTPPPAA